MESTFSSISFVITDGGDLATDTSTCQACRHHHSHLHIHHPDSSASCIPFVAKGQAYHACLPAMSPLECDRVNPTQHKRISCITMYVSATFQHQLQSLLGLSAALSSTLSGCLTAWRVVQVNMLPQQVRYHEASLRCGLPDVLTKTCATSH